MHPPPSFFYSSPTQHLLRLLCWLKCLLYRITLSIAEVLSLTKSDFRLRPGDQDLSRPSERKLTLWSINYDPGLAFSLLSLNLYLMEGYQLRLTVCCNNAGKINCVCMAKYIYIKQIVSYIFLLYGFIFVSVSLSFHSHLIRTPDQTSQRRFSWLVESSLCGVRSSALTSLCTSAIFCHDQNKSIRNIGQSLDFISGDFPFRSSLEDVSEF